MLNITLPSRLYLCLSQEYLAVTVSLGKGSDKCIKYKCDKGQEYFLFLPEKEVCLYFLKTKTSSLKVFYFKRNKFYKIHLSIFIPNLVKNIEF